jgi:phosphoribosyl 1,2-cyclic phosphodiesterase
MRVASLGSGSKGNSTVIEGREGRLLLDLGFGLKETIRRLARLDLTPMDIDAVLVTHEHADHINGVAAFSRKFHIPAYMTPSTYDAKRTGPLPALKPIQYGQSFAIGSIQVEPVVVPHDAREPCQFIFSEESSRVGVLTDLGHISAHVRDRYHDCDLLMLECNYDKEMLASGPYPVALKRRVAGDFGHLSNEQAAELVGTLNLPRLQNLVISHVSEKNNQPALAKSALTRVLCDWEGVLTLASQADGFGWIDLSS